MRVPSVSRAARPAKSAARLRRGAALALFALAVGALPAAPAAAVDYGEIGDKTFDVLVLRPLNAAAVLVGAGFFAISAPLVAPSGELATAFDVFVYAPYEYAFERPLGDF